MEIQLNYIHLLLLLVPVIILYRFLMYKIYDQLEKWYVSLIYWGLYFYGGIGASAKTVSLTYTIYLLIFLTVFALTMSKLPRHPSAGYLNTQPKRTDGSAHWDWVCFAAFFVFACWLTFATLNFNEGKFWIGFKGWSDFGANISLVQSFTFGHNFPTNHPFFPGEPIHYHFLFWFQAANLEFLGLNPVWSINLLSILSLMALLLLW